MGPINIREPVNAWTHFVTLIVAFISLPFLIVLTSSSITEMLVVTVYGLSMVALYGASTLYHWKITTPRKELLLRRLDHGSINLLIAGSATPIFYYGLSGVWRTVMLAVMWGLALFGGVFQVVFIKAPRWLKTVLYMLLGWVAVIPFPQLMKTLPRPATVLILLGGLSYTIGGIVYATKRMNFVPGRFGFHEVFHLFVSVGTLVHFAAVVVCIQG
ncbi:MAG: PAQR family membrane homeostasis protein TrhA [Bacillota bacterium]